MLIFVSAAGLAVVHGASGAAGSARLWEAASKGDSGAVHALLASGSAPDSHLDAAWQSSALAQVRTTLTGYCKLQAGMGNTLALIC